MKKQLRKLWELTIPLRMLWVIFLILTIYKKQMMKEWKFMMYETSSIPIDRTKYIEENKD